MPPIVGRPVNFILHAIQVSLMGPQILAFVPAFTLGGYWFGGEGVLVFMAIFLPSMLGLIALIAPMPSSPQSRAPADPVTRLPLQESVLAALDIAFCQEAETGLRTAALLLEIDDFDRHLDSHGPDAGNRVLAQVALQLETSLREGDVIARLNNSRFAIALAPARRIDLESMIQLSARLQHAIAKPVRIDGLSLSLTACIGFCLPRRTSERTGSGCLDAAQLALDDAQSCGKGAIRAFAAQPLRKKILRSGLVGEIANALESGQIKPWFQPQFSTDTGAVSGMEALARWDHPERGIILPGAFLPAISASGLNERLGEIILYHSFAALKAWDKAGCNVPAVAVNLSGDELSDPKLCDKIRWELDRFDLAPSRLNIAILEPVVARSENETITRNIVRLSEMGCGIDLDDFGTGHTSIANIRRFSVSRVKIDRSFITRIDSDRDQQQMLTAVLEIAERMNISTLAEGVETVAEHALLAQLGCAHVQGYSIARPMPFDDSLAWIARHREKLTSECAISQYIG